MSLLFNQNVGEESAIKFGLLYNRYAIYESNLLPTDWVITGDYPMYEVLFALTGDFNNAGAIKDVSLDYWDLPNTGAANAGGMSIRASGGRLKDGTYFGFKQGAYVYQDDSNYQLGSYGLSNSIETDLFNFPLDYQEGYPTIVIWNGIGVPPNQITDYDGNIYDVLKVTAGAAGDVYFLKQYWACTNLNDGTPIPLVTDNTAWSNLTTMGYCYPNGDINNV